jgi:TolB-like protein
MFSAGKRISINDLLVNSRNPKLEYVGKGIAEMIAVELVKSRSVSLIAREKRTKLLEETEFALSDLADPDSQVELGRMLAADFMVFGNLIDMDKQLLISMQMVSIETGEVVWADKLMESLANYEYISGYFAGSILRSMNAEVASTTEDKVEVKEAKSEEVVLAFSKAIDYYDKKDTEKARKELSRAKKIDPKAEAVQVYLRKLASASPKFQVEIDRYAPTYNPAFFGMIEHDIIYLWSSNSLEIGEEEKGRTRVENYDLREIEKTIRLGYILPLGERLGLGVEIVWTYVNNHISMADHSTLYTFESQDYGELGVDNRGYGAYAALGYRFMEGLSLGAAFQVSYTGETPDQADIVLEGYSKLNVSVDLGFLVQAWEDRLLFDLHGIYTTQAEPYYDEAAKVIEPGRLPFILAGTLTTAFFNKQLFLSLKGIGDIYPEDRSGYTIRAIPAIEFWPFTFLAIRGGYEYAQIDISDRFKIGHGGFGGISLMLGKWEFNANLTYRNKPTQVLPGYSLDDMTVMIGVVKNDTFLRR